MLTVSMRLLVRVSALVALAGCGARSGVEGAGASKGAGGSANGGAGGENAGGANTGGESTGGTNTGGTNTGGVNTGGSSTTTATGGTGGGGPTVLSIVEACTTAVSCGQEAGWLPFGVNACIDAFGRLDWNLESPPYLPDRSIATLLLECAGAAVGDCGAFQSCFGGDWVSLMRCREGGYCDGNLISGSFDMGPSFDCGGIGATCVDLSSGAQRACCNAEVCTAFGEFECDGTVAKKCGGWGDQVIFDCALSGRKCEPDEWTPCVGDGAACDPEVPIDCKGDTAVYCSGGFLATYDCQKTLLRTSCAGGAPSTWPACIPKGKACDPMVDVVSCDASALVVCADGEWLKVDCPTLGFAQCFQTFENARCAN